jgi:hypothetical protein
MDIPQQLNQVDKPQSLQQKPQQPKQPQLPPQMALPKSDVQTAPIVPRQIDHKDRQIGYEIRKRHWQRYFFYVVLSVIFLAMIAYIVFIYNSNTKLINDITTANQDLETASQNLIITTQNLTDSEKQLVERQREIDNMEKLLADSQIELDQKTADLQKETDEKTQLISKYNNFKVQLGSADANIYSFLINYSTGVSAWDIAKIPLAEYNFGGEDIDGDGLSDAIELALGTDISKADTDGDGFDDKSEFLNGYNPWNENKLAVDYTFIALNSGLILIQVEEDRQAWYINPNDGKRYFLGSPANVLAEIEKL